MKLHMYINGKSSIEHAVKRLSIVIILSVVTGADSHVLTLPPSSIPQHDRDDPKHNQQEANYGDGKHADQLRVRKSYAISELHYYSAVPNVVAGLQGWIGLEHKVEEL